MFVVIATLVRTRPGPTTGPLFKRKLPIIKKADEMQVKHEYDQNVHNTFWPTSAGLHENFLFIVTVLLLLLSS